MQGSTAGQRKSSPTLQWDSFPLPLSLTCLPYTEMEIGATDQVRATITKEVETQERQFGVAEETSLPSHGMAVGMVKEPAWQGDSRSFPNIPLDRNLTQV